MKLSPFFCLSSFQLPLSALVLFANLRTMQRTSYMLETKLKELSLFPILGKPIAKTCFQFDFTDTNKELQQIDLQDTAAFTQWVEKTLQQHHKQFGIGGFFENRYIYKRSAHFGGEEPRCIHLGIDIWTPAFQEVYAPIEGTVHSFQNNDNFGDYGPTIILQHEIHGNTFFSLYGHLTLDSLKGIKKGEKIAKGQKFCAIGPYPENGNWPPHLHFQVMREMLGKEGDFPGVCAPSEVAQFRKIMINPMLLIR